MYQYISIIHTGICAQHIYMCILSLILNVNVSMCYIYRYIYVYIYVYRFIRIAYVHLESNFDINNQYPMKRFKGQHCTKFCCSNAKSVRLCRYIAPLWKLKSFSILVAQQPVLEYVLLQLTFRHFLRLTSGGLRCSQKRLLVRTCYLIYTE